MRRVRLLEDAFPDRPAFDTAVSRALLTRVSAEELPETLRLHLPGDVVAFGRQDVVTSGYHHAVRAARSGGFAAVERLAGGRAAVFHRRTIAFSWAIPDQAPRETITGRFAELAGLVRFALQGLGVDARVGEVPGEYCPGGYSINARGERKLMGVGQRLMRRAAHVGGVIVVGDTARVRDILVPVYAAMDLEWNPATVGSIEDEIGPVTYREAQRALVEAFQQRFELIDGCLDQGTLDLAKRLEPEHRSPD